MLTLLLLMKKNMSVYEIDDHEKIRLPLTSAEWLEVTLALFNQQSKVKVDEVDSTFKLIRIQPARRNLLSSQ